MNTAGRNSITARSKARKPVHPPVVSLGALRSAAGLRIDDILDRLEEETGVRPGRGTISAIENGHRGASREMVEALEAAYGLAPGSIMTSYEPRATQKNFIASA